MRKNASKPYLFTASPLSLLKLSFFKQTPYCMKIPYLALLLLFCTKTLAQNPNNIPWQIRHKRLTANTIEISFTAKIDTTNIKISKEGACALNPVFDENENFRVLKDPSISFFGDEGVKIFKDSVSIQMVLAQTDSKLFSKIKVSFRYCICKKDNLAFLARATFFVYVQGTEQKRVVVIDSGRRGVYGLVVD